MKVLMLTLVLVVLGTVTAPPPPRRPGRGNGRPGGPAPPPRPSGPAPSPGPAGPAPAPGPGSSPFLMSPPAPPPSSPGRSGSAPGRRPGGAPTSGRLPHGIPQPPPPPGQAPPQGPRDQRPRERRIPIMPSGDHRGSAPGNAPRPADTPDPVDQASRDAMPVTCHVNGEYLRSKVNCGTYYRCVPANNTAFKYIMLQCQDGLSFDTDLNVCNWAGAVNCTPTTTTTTTTTTEDPTASVTPSTRAPVIELPDFDEECKEETVIRVKKLDNGSFLAFQCTPGFGYFPLHADCDPSSKSCIIPVKDSLPDHLPLRINTVRRVMDDSF